MWYQQLASSDNVDMPAPGEMIPSFAASRDTAPARAEETANAWELVHHTSHCTYPSFMKTLRSSNLRTLGQFRLEIPATFVKEHGHKIQATVVLHGPSGRVTVVHLRIKSYAVQDRVHFGGSGWRAFVLENELKVGHHLVFSLVAKSTFVVRHFSGPAAKAKIRLRSVDGAIQSSNSCQGMNHPAKVVKSGKSPSERQLVGVPRSSVDDSFQNNVPLPNLKNDVVYAHRTSRMKQKVNKLVEKLQCPHFVTAIWKSNLSEHRSSTLNVPLTFVEKYGAYFAKRINIFQGPTGRMVEVCFSGARHSRFTTGWKAFHRENDIKLGDVLLFSLRAPACWFVQLVESQAKELIIRKDCNSNNLE